MKRLLTGIIVVISTVQPAAAQTWNCRNTAVEISCIDGTCKIAGNHTPMDVSLTMSGQMKVCAYSGCWQGKANTVLASGHYLTFTGDDLKWSHGSKTSGAQGAVTIDTSNKTATIMIENFAHPMSCKHSP